MFPTSDGWITVGAAQSNFWVRLCDLLDAPELRPDRWTITTVIERVAQRGDLFGPALTLKQDLPELG